KLIMNKHYGFVTGAFFAAIIVFGLSVPSTGLAKSTCSGGAITGGTINGGLTVTSDCSVSGATINGGITQTGGFLEVCGSQVSGGVNSTGGTAIVLGEVETDSCAGSQIN